MVRLHIGTYAASGGTGLVPVTLDDDRGFVCGRPFPDAANASFAATGNGLVYAVDEREAGAVNVLRRDRGEWRRLARVPSGGAAPCYVALAPDGRHLAVANYAGGSAALYRLDEGGRPLGPPALFQNEGRGADAQRQEGPHAHCVRFLGDGQALCLVDLGTDQVLRLAMTNGGFGQVSVAWTAPAGAGPRHMLVHPARPLALVLSELAATLTLLETAVSGFAARQTVRTAPAAFAEANLGGHLALNSSGTRVYVSNRGHDSLAVFALDGERLELLQHAPSGGAHPRHFALLEERAKIVVAHERDGSVVSFDLQPDGTVHGPVHRTRVPGACFVLA